MTTPRPATPWVHCLRPNPNARLRLLCFAHAGGGASSFARWGLELPGDIEVCAIQLPGHEERFREPPIMRLTDLLPLLLEQIGPLLESPFAFFGHSMGALISFELARTLEQHHGRSPVHLFISSRRAPHLPPLQPLLHRLPDAAFLRAMQSQYEAIPAAVQHDAEMLALVLRILRADMELLECYTFQPAPALRCPMTVVGGIQDQTLEQEELASWQIHTAAAFRLRLFAGGHFYLHTDRAPLLHMLAASI